MPIYKTKALTLSRYAFTLSGSVCQEVVVRQTGGEKGRKESRMLAYELADILQSSTVCACRGLTTFSGLRL